MNQYHFPGFQKYLDNLKASPVLATAVQDQKAIREIEGLISTAARHIQLGRPNSEQVASQALEPIRDQIKVLEAAIKVAVHAIGELESALGEPGDQNPKTTRATRPRSTTGRGPAKAE